MDYKDIPKTENQIRLDAFHAALISEYGEKQGEDIFSFVCSIIGDFQIRFIDDVVVRNEKIKRDLYAGMNREEIARKYNVSISTVNHAVGKSKR